MTPAQAVIVRVWFEESEWWGRLSFDTKKTASRALARNISGTAVYCEPDCSTALRLGLKPRQVHTALIEAGLREAKE